MMRTAILLLALPLLSLNCNAHEYFFAFAEMDYNAAEKCFEITLEGSAHDIEDVMNKTGLHMTELEDHYNDQEMLTKIEAFINEGFRISTAGTGVALKLIGMEVKTNGMVYFYLRSETIEPMKTLDVTFDWLMDTLPQQQNKLTLRKDGHKYTAVFLPGKRSETLQI